MKGSLLAFSLLCAVANPAKAEFIDDSNTLRNLLTGNSLVGTYNDLHFIQILKPDGHVEVAIKGETDILKAQWYVSENGEYCEQWPDHTSCFKIGIDHSYARNNKNVRRLLVKGQDDAKIDSYLHQGQIPLEFGKE